MLIFVAGPYSDSLRERRVMNVDNVHKIVKELILRGHIVLECHSLEDAFYDDADLTHAHFMRQTLAWLKHCDAIYFIGASPGATTELNRARALGLRVFTSLDQVPEIRQFEAELQEIRSDLALNAEPSDR